MKNLIMILTLLLSLALVSCEEPHAEDTSSYEVCCREIYLETLNPITHEIEFSDYESTNISCKSDSENLIIRQIIDCNQ